MGQCLNSALVNPRGFLFLQDLGGYSYLNVVALCEVGVFVEVFHVDMGLGLGASRGFYGRNLSRVDPSREVDQFHTAAA